MKLNYVTYETSSLFISIILMNILFTSFGVGFGYILFHPEAKANIDKIINDNFGEYQIGKNRHEIGRI